MSLLGIAVGTLRAVANAAERLEGGGHGSACEESKAWESESPEGRIVPIRIRDEVIARMFSETGWEYDAKGILLRNLGDGTYSMFFIQAEEVDHLSNRVVQQMMMTALDLSSSLDSTNCDLSPEAIEALSSFKRAARQRLQSA